MNRFLTIALAGLVILPASSAIAQQGGVRIEVDRHRSVCRQSTGIEAFFDTQANALATADPGVDHMVVACAAHANGNTYYWARRRSAEEAEQAAVAECGRLAQGNLNSYGPVEVPCTVYGRATRTSN